MRGLLDFFLPRTCLGCALPLGGEHRPLPLCGRCEARLVAAPATGCRGCGRELQQPSAWCGSCRQQPPPYAELLAGWSYESPFDEVVKAFKFGGLVGLAGPLARLLAEVLALRLGDRLAAVDLVVPVPLHPWRQLRRGFNQAERLARPLARRLGLAFGEPLRRRRLTVPQARLGRRSRSRNLEDVFRPSRRARVEDLRILLLDDVVTTTATLQAAARTLRQAGAREVLAAALARTPEVPRQTRSRPAGPGAGIHGTPGDV